MSAFTDWLAKADAARVLLADITVRSGGQSVTRRVASRWFHTGSTDTPANAIYQSRLVGDPYFVRRMSEAFGGRTFASIGGIEVDNIDGALDGWIADDPRDVVLRLGDASWPIASFGIIYSGQADRWEVVDRNTLRLVLRDAQKRLDVPASSNLITSGPNTDAPVPLCYGYARNVSPVLIDDTSHIYQVHDGAIDSVQAVKLNGLATGAWSASGADLAAGQFRLNAAPTGTVTADIKGAKVGGAWLYRPGEIALDLVKRAGLTSGEYSASAFSALDTAAPYTVGLYVQDRRNLLDVLDELIGRSLAGYYGTGRDNVFGVGLLNAPGTPVATFNRIEQVKHGLGITTVTPNWRVRIGHERNWTVQSTGADSGVTEANRAWLEAAYRYEVDEDTDIQTDYRNAEEAEINTLIDTAANAQTEATRRLSLFGTLRRRYRLTAFSGPFQVALGDTVQLVNDRYGMSAGINAVVTGLRDYLLRNRCELECWA